MGTFCWINFDGPRWRLQFNLVCCCDSLFFSEQTVVGDRARAAILIDMHSFGDVHPILEKMVMLAHDIKRHPKSESMQTESSPFRVTCK